MAPNDSTWTAPSSKSSPAVAAHPTAAGERKRGGRFTGRRAKKPKVLAIITDACTGCAGAPVCQICCPVEECMLLQPADDAFPFGRIWVDPLKCVGCRKCVRQGPAETFLDGCPWDAILMVPTADWEVTNGGLPY